ncbi:MAG: hypothetical protein MR797_05665 [Lachnospiraceae bacterium]|nr:hypothetical protein [Lachnospiraceae bacterium]
MGKGQLGGAPSWFKKITDKIRRDISNTQGQNLITYPYFESSKTENGIQFSIRSDGSIKVNGHATADTYFKIHSYLKSDGNLTVPFGIYALSGCPKGGSESTYFMQVTMSIAGSEYGIITDYGNGGIGDIDNEGDYITSTDAYIGIKICVKSGTTVSDLIFKPMLEKGTAYHEYQPTNLTNKTLKNILSGLNKVGNFKAVSTEANQELSDTEKSNARANIGLGNVGIFKAVSTEADQGLTDTEKSNARANIGLGNVGNFKAVSTVANQGLTDTEKSNARANIGLGNTENKSSATIRGELTSSNITAALGYTPINPIAKGANNGIAELDSNGKVPSSQLPSFVDDVIEGYLYNGKFYKESAHTNVINGESGKIYIDLSTGKTYRWSGSTFVVISDTLALGETSSTAYRGDRGKVAYDHSQSAHAPSNAQANVIEAVKVNGTALKPSSKAVNITINGSNLKTSATKTASITSSISNSIASGTALDTAIQTLLNNDKTLDTKSDEVDNKSISTYDANVYYNYGNVVHYEGKVYRHIKVSSGGTPGVKGQVPTNKEYWKEITVSDLFRELSFASNILSSLTSNDFDYSGGPTMIGAPQYTVNESLKAIANVLSSLNSNLGNKVSKSGDTINGTLRVTNGTNTVGIFADGEGGNIDLNNAPMNRALQQDVYNGNYRAYLYQINPWQYLNDITIHPDKVTTQKDFVNGNGISLNGLNENLDYNLIISSTYYHYKLLLDFKNITFSNGNAKIDLPDIPGYRYVNYGNIINIQNIRANACGYIDVNNRQLVITACWTNTHDPFAETTVVQYLCFLVSNND